MGIVAADMEFGKRGPAAMTAGNDKTESLVTQK